MFETIFGSNIIKENFDMIQSKKVLLVTQENLFEKYKALIPEKFTVQCIDNIEEDFMKELNETLPEADIIVGFGGGLSIDGAKYFSWQRNVPCILVPTAISVDACYSYPIALRNNSKVIYKGEVLPEKILVDYEIIRSAPKELNLSGVGDVLSCYTALFDWTLMDQAGKGPKIAKHQYDGAEKILSDIFSNTDDIRDMTDKGIEIIMNGYKWVGIEGYNYRYCHFEEGSEHYLAYTIESICKKHLLHGRLVCLCAYIMSKFHREGRQNKVLEFTNAIGLSIKPEAVGLTYDEIISALKTANSYAVKNGLSYSVLNEKEISENFINEVIEELKAI